MKKILEETLLAIEEKKKCLMKKRPLDPLIEKNIYEWSKVGLTYASNAIEGNTLTEGETAQILEKGIAIGGKTIVEHLEALGHAKAVDLISEIALKKTRQEITVSDVLEIHKVLLEQILPLYAGRFRQSSVRISGSSVARPNALKVPDLMDQLLASLKTSQNSEVLIAADLHLDFVFIHPFVDGNGRTARLLSNLVLLQAGFPLVKIDVKNRIQYINAIEKAFLSSDREDYYLVWFQAIETTLDEYLRPDFLGV